jgi:hypothetical protein
MVTASKWLQALTIEERIALLRKLSVFADSGGNDKSIDISELIASISPKTLESYGIADRSILTRLRPQSGRSLDDGMLPMAGSL